MFSFLIGYFSSFMSSYVLIIIGCFIFKINIILLFTVMWRLKWGFFNFNLHPIIFVISILTLNII